MEVEVRYKAIECFEYVWGASKIAVGRWGDMVETSMDRNTFLKAVQYAYEILPVFVSLEINEHLEMVENVMLLALNTVRTANIHLRPVSWMHLFVFICLLLVNL